jgi:cation diffusion facilitator family transporter
MAIPDTPAAGLHARWRHGHDFLPDRSAAERSTRWVMLLTATTMVLEIVAGTLSGSMALLADGWHMGTHVAAFGIAIYAYRYARLNAHDPRFTFGTGKVTDLGGFASALALAFVALAMVIESVRRLFEPRQIAFDEALWVAALGLAVNLASALILTRQGSHHHDDEHHDHDHDHEHDADAEDHNLRAAYLHVIADALTSVLALVALIAGKYLGWSWLDPVMGLVGAVLILRWAQGLARTTGRVLLDGVDHTRMRDEIRAAIEGHADAARRGESVSDLHLWTVGPRRLAATLCIVAHEPDTPAAYRRRLARFQALVHVIVEVNRCDDPACRLELRRWSP